MILTYAEDQQELRNSRVYRGLSHLWHQLKISGRASLPTVSINKRVLREYVPLLSGAKSQEFYGHGHGGGRVGSFFPLHIERVKGKKHFIKNKVATILKPKCFT